MSRETITIDFGNFSGLLLSLCSNVSSITGLFLITFATMKLLYSLLGAVLIGFTLLVSGTDVTVADLLTKMGLVNIQYFFSMILLLLAGMILRFVGRFLSSKSTITWLEDLTGKERDSHPNSERHSDRRQD